MMSNTIISVVGARPQFIKAAPVSKVLRSRFKEIIIHTGQHYDAGMSDVFFDELQIPRPDINLGIGSGSHAEQTGKMLIDIEKVLLQVKPDIVLVYGDTNSTLAAALAAAKVQIPIAHVESGLRSYNRRMPEEINRVLCDHVSTWLFCPTSKSVENLACESILSGVYLVGDVMYDVLRRNLPLARQCSTILKQTMQEKGSYVLTTIHRASNTDNIQCLRIIINALGRLSKTVLFPAHPRTKYMLRDAEIVLPDNVMMIDPLGYMDMLVLEENANCILTDSGGIQKEAFILGVRCITLREETEWVETVQAGWNKLVGTSIDDIVDAVETWFPSSERLLLYGDGYAAEKIAEILSKIS